MSSDYIRIIDPSEIKVGMVIEWDNGADFIVKSTVTSVNTNRFCNGTDYYINDEESQLGLISDKAKVKVISEPEIIQPEEPTSFGACVVVSGIRFVRYLPGSIVGLWSGDDDSIADWAELCSMGQVKIVNEDPFSEV